jgi:hypothetical protein
MFFLVWSIMSQYFILLACKMDLTDIFWGRGNRWAGKLACQGGLTPGNIFVRNFETVFSPRFSDPGQNVFLHFYKEISVCLVIDENVSLGFLRHFAPNVLCTLSKP